MPSSYCERKLFAFHKITGFAHSALLKRSITLKKIANCVTVILVVWTNTPPPQFIILKAFRKRWLGKEINWSFYRKVATDTFGERMRIRIKITGRSSVSHTYSQPSSLKTRWNVYLKMQPSPWLLSTIARNNTAEDHFYHVICCLYHRVFGSQSLEM